MFVGVLLAVIPVFLVIGAGFVAVQTRYLDPASLGALGGFVLRIALPALIFQALTAGPIAATLNGHYLLAYGAGSIAVFLIGFVGLRRFAGERVAAAAVQAGGMCGSNSGFMGYPIAAMMIGPPAAGILAQNMIIENLLVIPLMFVLAEAGQGGRRPVGAMLVGIVASLVRNPLLIAIALGLAVAASGLRLPEPVARPVVLMGAVAGPVALFVVGGTLAGLPRGGTAIEVARIAAGKLVLHPLAVFAALGLVPGIDPVVRAGGTIFAAVPMMSIFPIVGGRFGLGGLAAAALLVTTLASLVTISLVVVGLGHLGLITPP